MEEFLCKRAENISPKSMPIGHNLDEFLEVSLIQDKNFP
jgi:hypothetical protein